MSSPLPFREDVKQWSVEQLAAWLQQRDFPDIADIYLRKGIDGHKLITLEEGEHISILNSLSLRARLDLLNIIKKIKNQPSIQNQKSQRQNVQSNLRKPSQAAPPPPVSSVNHRYDITNAVNSSESSLVEENEMSDSSVPYIDDTVNEDYLVPLSIGLGSVGLEPSTVALKLKKDRCPSPPPPPPPDQGSSLLFQLPPDPSPPYQPPRTKSKQRKKIQDLELPRPPINADKIIPSYTESKKKFTGFTENSSTSKYIEKIESRDDFNAYEIIQESPSESESRTDFDSQVSETDSKPPNLPYRNLVTQGTTSAPIVPIRTHASTQHRHPTLHRPQPHLPDVLSSNSVTSTHPLSNLPVSKVVSDVGTRSQPSIPSTEYLYLDDKKSVPMNSLYKSLLDKPYFHPVTRTALSKILVDDGMFLVRPSTHSQHLLTLSISNNGKIFNIVIRIREDSKYALGTKKPGEIAFFNIDEIIKFHSREAIKVEDGSLVYLKRSPLKDKSLC